MAAIGPHDPSSLHSLVGSSAHAATTPTASSGVAVAPGRPANIAGSLAAPRIDLPTAARDHTVASVHARAAEPTRATVGSRQAVAQQRLGAAADKLKEARDNGVSLAKTSFFKKLIYVATSIVAVGVAAALTAVSGGIAAPLLAVSSVNLAVNIGDSVCAYRNMRHAQDLAAGKPNPRPATPCGNSCIQNLTYAVAKGVGIESHETRLAIAKAVGGIFQAGLTVGAVVAGEAAGALALAPKIAITVANGIKALVAIDTVVTSGLTEAELGPQYKGRTRELLESAARQADSARSLDGTVRTDVADAEIQRVLSGDPAALDRSRQLVDTAVGQYGDTATNTGQGFAACVAVGRAVVSMVAA